MTRFQLIFRDDDGDRSETRDNNMDDEPHIDGKLIVDGQTYTIRGVERIIRKDGSEGEMGRFICTLAAEPVV